MSRPGLELHAYAKINWTLEVLGRRPDGYHEVRTIMQTIALADTVTLQPADGLSLSITGEAGALASEGPESNLAYRAAELLRERTAHRGGAHIRLTKRIPFAAGLGGGSSDAAAVLRGLRRLWKLDMSDEELAQIAAELGSDAPFFLRGGTALATGRGEVIESLPDAPARTVFVACKQQPIAGKTARMYAALGPAQYTDGSRTERLAERLRAGEPVRDEDVCNVFEAVLPEVDAEAAETFRRASKLGIGRPHLCGSGSAFFIVLEQEQDSLPLVRALKDLGLSAIENWTVSTTQALAPETAS